tara:strand:- start:4854 stop:5051 length:198 start_codon:yes stop_codon:yes gene_type:complete
MANPLYGSNKQDGMLDALASADETIAAAGTSAGSAGKSDGCAADKVITVSIKGVTYYIPLFDQNS